MPLTKNEPEGDSYLYRRVENQITTMIESGALAPGDKLPSLRKFSVRTSLSISTINQAYLELEKRGLIESRPRSGFYVRSGFRSIPCMEPSKKTPLKPRQVTRANLIQRVHSFVGRKDVASFGPAYPVEDILPMAALSRIASRVARNCGREAVTYEIVPGNEELRRQISFRSMDSGVISNPDEIIITNGATEAFNLALMALTKPGDNVLIPSPSYYGFLQALEKLGLNAIEIRSCPKIGLMFSDLTAALKKFNIKLCLVTPNFSNPDGSLMDPEAKRELVRLLNHHEIPMIEDDVFGDLYFKGARPVTCRKFDKKGLVITCSSFSKTVAPGYRLGWVDPGRFYDQILQMKGVLNPCNPTLTQIILAEYLKSGQHDGFLKHLRWHLERQMATLKAKICQYFPPTVKSSQPHGGMVLWLEFSQRFDSGRFFARAEAEGVGVVPGLIFSNQDRYRNYIRMGYGNVWSPRLEEAIKILGRIASEMEAGG